MKESRGRSFVFLAVVYLLAGALGIFCYRILPVNGIWLKLFLADVIATVFVFLCSVFMKNASVYDPYWSVQPPVILTAFACSCSLNAFGICLLIAVWYWAIRLTGNWAYTFKNLTCQDWRYTMLQEKTGKAYPLVNFIGIHLVPTVVVFGAILPAVYAVENGLKATWASYVCLALCIASASLQLVADVEMHRYRKNRTTPFIRVGVWKYARHPNYLGEICMWWGIGLSVFFADFSLYYLLAGALANTLLFIFVSIPMADKRQSQKEGYAEYRKQTRHLLPIYKKQ